MPQKLGGDTRSLHSPDCYETVACVIFHEIFFVYMYHVHYFSSISICQAYYYTSFIFLLFFQ